MSILVNDQTRVLVQGFTGSQATLHSEQSIEYGTNIVGGVTPGKGGTTHLNKPVFNSVADAAKAEEPNAALIFVPADRKSTRLNSSHSQQSRMPSSA